METRIKTGHNQHKIKVSISSVLKIELFETFLQRTIFSPAENHSEFHQFFDLLNETDPEPNFFSESSRLKYESIDTRFVHSILGNGDI